jgi:plastocyanin
VFTVVLLSATWAVPAPSVATQLHIIEVGDFYFQPERTVIAPGDTVRWILVSGVHTITSDPTSPKSWASDTMTTSGQTFELVFTYDDGPGPFPYHCAIHPATMTGTILVADTCLATGSTQEGFPINVADLIYAIRILSGLTPPPDELYRFDLNGDCVVDTADMTLFSCAFEHGLLCLPVYPVPTCCFPEFVVSPCPVPMTGDVDTSLTITASDIIFTVGYLFKSGPAPLPCAAAADVNCSGDITAADLVYLVAHVFKGGAAPCNVCDLWPETWTCP